MQPGAVAVAAEDERARPRLQHVGEILRTHQRRGLVHIGVAGERDRVRAEMRHLVVRLGDLARSGGREEVREYVAPLVDVLLSMRGEARREQRFSDADRLRAILADCGVEVQDTPSGTAWSLVNA